MGNTTLLHVRSALILLCDGVYLPGKAAEILFDCLEKVVGTFQGKDWRLKFYQGLRDLIEQKIRLMKWENE